MAEQEASQHHLEVVLAVNGVFHLFDLARELDERGMLKGIYSTFPWIRLRREGIARKKVWMFPWIHTPQLYLTRWWSLYNRANRNITVLMYRTFDAWVARSMPQCDIYVAHAGCGLRSGRRAQQSGARYICDRGSSHIRYQDRIVGEEYRRWGLQRIICDPRVIALEEAEYEQADAIVVPSEFARRSYVEMGVPAHKVHKIPYGVRLEMFRRVAEPAAGRFEVLFAGSVNLRKGVPYLLEAFRQLKHPGKRLRIVGGVHSDFRRVLAELPQDGVEFLGHLPQKQLAAVMSSSHVMVLPSIEEGLALVQGQALACGCPLISSFHTGGDDLFTDSVEGFLVPVRSPEAIAARLQQLADDPDLQQRMSQAALLRVRHIGGWHEYGEMWAQLAQNLTTSHLAARS